MIKFIPNYITHTDTRGEFKGMINSGYWMELNNITSEAGSIRGNHYHKKTTELFIIMNGNIKVTLQKVCSGKLIGNSESVCVTKGDVFLIDSMTNHTFESITESNWINVLSSPMDNEHPDLWRVGPT